MWFAGRIRFSTDLSFGYGTTTTTTDQQQLGSVQSGTQERSLVGSVNGSVTLAAGAAGGAGGAATTGTADGALTISGSDVQAGQDITATGTRVQIDPGQDRSDATTHTNSVTDAVSVAVGGSVVKAAQSLQSLSASATTKNKRLQDLALAAQAMAAAQAAAAVVADGGSVSVSLTASHSENTTGQTDTGTSHAGSQLSAGRNVQITATGAGTETGAGAGATNPDNGNITIIGSGITADHNVALSARQDLRIAAAQDSEAHTTEHSDWTVGAGIGISYSGKDGAALGVTANAGVGVATQQSQARTQLNSHLTAGHHLGLDSYTAQLNALRATGEFVYQPVLDASRDFITRNGETTQRVGGAVNLAAGTLGTVGGGILATGGVTTCIGTLGLGYAVAPIGAAIAVTSNQQAQQGYRALLGAYQSSEGQRVLDSLNPATYPGERDPLVNAATSASGLADQLDLSTFGRWPP